MRESQLNPNEDFEDHDVPQSAESIAKRALVNQCVIAAGHGVSKARIKRWLKQEGLWADASPKERRFLESRDASEQDCFNATWRAEAQVALLWAIRKIRSLGNLGEMCNSGQLVDAIPALGASTKEFIKTAKLRSKKKIEEEYETIYDSHWRLRDAKRRGLDFTESINPDVIQERHYAFNWIMGYCGQTWDEMTTDT